MGVDDRPADGEAYTPAHLFSSKERFEDPRRVLDDDHHTFAFHWLIDSLQSGLTALLIVTGAEPRVYYILSREAQVNGICPK